MILFQQLTRRGASDPVVLKPLGLDPLCIQIVEPDEDEDGASWMRLDGGERVCVAGTVVQIVSMVNGEPCPEQASIETL